MDDPRETVRQWFAERLRNATCAHVPLNPGAAVGQPEACPGCLADAILSTPGVEVDEERLISAGEGWGWLRDPAGTHGQVVVRLPAQPREEET